MKGLPAIIGVILTAALIPDRALSDSVSFDLMRYWEMPAHRSLQRLRLDSSEKLSPFISDGCSGGLSAGWKILAEQFDGFAESYGSKPLWESCCIAHDRVYHSAGGDHDPRASFAARLQADRDFEQCLVLNGENYTADLSETLGVPDAMIMRVYAGLARMMYVAVRTGGAPCTGLPWRWGFGHDHCLPFGGNWSR